MLSTTTIRWLHTHWLYYLSLGTRPLCTKSRGSAVWFKGGASIPSSSHDRNTCPMARSVTIAQVTSCIQIKRYGCHWYKSWTTDALMSTVIKEFYMVEVNPFHYCSMTSRSVSIHACCHLIFSGYASMCVLKTHSRLNKCGREIVVSRFTSSSPLHVK